MLKLSIIIPYYNVKPYTDELLDCLAPQITDEVEVILIDDGSDKPYKTDYKWCQVYRQKNGGASSARNAGLERATGEYVVFIDSDDLVADDYVNQIFAKMPFDYLEMSWRSVAGAGAQFFAKLNSIHDRLDNPSAVTRAWNRAFIGDLRFNEHKQVAEDAEFTKILLNRQGARRAVITDYLYFYRTSTPNSLTKRYANGQTDTKRIVYFYNRVTRDMTALLDEIKAEYQNHEIYVLTYRCDIPELYEYANVEPPHAIRGSELRGEPFKDFTQFERPIETQVVIYTNKIEKVSGLTTFIVNFCKVMSKYYDIMVIYSDSIDSDRLRQLRKYVDTRKNTGAIICDILIVNSIYDNVPTNIRYTKKLQMCHTCKMPSITALPTDNDGTVYVSDTAMKSWGISDGTVIHNMLYSTAETTDKCLMLISCMRDSYEKGIERMKAFAKLLKDNGVAFIWLVFSSGNIHGLPDGMIQMKPVIDVLPYLKMADYLVALSDIEAYPYAIREALYEADTAVITTPIDVLDEIGFTDGEDGYIVPFDISKTEDKTIDNIVHNIPRFEYSRLTNTDEIKAWRKLLGNKKPKHTYDPTAVKTVKVIQGYTDIALNQFLKVGEIHEMPIDRVQVVVDAGFCEVIE